MSLVIDFTAPSALLREQNRMSMLPILGNGPPGTFVLFPGYRVSLPTDQIVFADDTGGHAESNSVGCSSWVAKADSWYSCGFANCFRRNSSRRLGVT